jgi:protein-tyrosine phosphatase
MQATVYWIEGPWRGKLAILPRPRGGDWLMDEVRAWKEAGIDLVVSLITQEEITELDLAQESALCKSQNIEFKAFSIPDRGLPSSRGAFFTLLGQLGRVLTEGKNVAVHCRQGIGRSALVVASLLICSGEGAKAALERVRTARGCTVPETMEQQKWIEEFERRLPTRINTPTGDRA